MDVWFASDHHFSHRNLVEKFTKADGSPARTFIPDGETEERGFHSVEEMDEVLIERHNRAVGQFDKVYFLGDVSMDQKRYMSIMSRLNGKKRLILGNHDKLPMECYTKFFEKVMESWQPVRNVVFTHRPILLGNHDHHGKLTYNVHGHVHNHDVPDSRYLNICAEKTKYAPVHWDQIVKKLGIKTENSA